ncbi:MAG: ATP-binding protein, partial [Pseudomonadota bacterium]
SGRLAAARQQRMEVHKAPLRLDDLARDMVEVFLEGRAAAVNLDAASPVEVPADREQLGKVLMNLLLNAAEAGAQNIDLRVHADKGWAVVTVRDDGPGIERDFLERRLFQLFATTKAKGLGIGLYQSRVIVEAHGGRLEADSAPGAGATFRLRLPPG